MSQKTYDDSLRTLFFSQRKKRGAMHQQKDVIIKISPERERYFGRSGKMLLPSPSTVADRLRKIPAGQLLSTSKLREELAEQFHVQVTCPVATRNALKEIANEKPAGVPYWRVTRANGELMSIYPGGIERHAALLKSEGYPIDATGRLPRVKTFTPQ